MRYVDGYVLPVPKKNLLAYRRMAQQAGKVWRDHGALEYGECVADDVKPGKLTSFPQSVKFKPGDIVVFSWIVFKSRAHRDRVTSSSVEGTNNFMVTAAPAYFIPKFFRNPDLASASTKELS